MQSVEVTALGCVMAIGHACGVSFFLGSESFRSVMVMFVHLSRVSIDHYVPPWPLSNDSRHCKSAMNESMQNSVGFAAN